MNSFKILIFLELIFSSCLQGSDYYRDRVEPFLKALQPSYKPKLIDGVQEPELPDLDEDKKTLEGIDQNKDGVRDDMEIFINRNFKFEYERESLKADFKRVNDYYKSYKIMNADDEVKFQSNHSEDLRFVRYAYSELHLPESPEIIKYQHYSALFNGKKRKEAYEFNSKKLAGRIYGYGYGDPSIFVNCLKKFKSKYSKINQ